ncbi:MAG: hypothetical protein ACXVAY_09240 [Mucilaginibacter sp.]
MNKKFKSPIKDKAALRAQILKSMVASFKIEGINISEDAAISSLKRVSISLEK